MRSLIIRLFILLGLFFSVGGVYAADTWVTKAPMFTQRFNAAAAVVNGKLYVVGGKDAANAAMSTTEEYDPANNTWVTKASMPTPRWNFALAVVNGKLYAIGGKSGGATAAVAGMNNNEEYDPVANTWAVKAAMPTGRNGRGAGVINGKIYVVGGRIGPNTAPVFTSINEEYNPATNTWATKAPMPTPRANLAAAVINNKLYALGGWDGTALSPSVNKNEEYDPLTDTWVAKAPMMVPREDIAAAVVNNKLYAIGGFVANGTGSLLETNSNEEYDPATNSWLSRSPMPTARGTATAAVLNNLVYAVGGSNGVYASTGGVGSVLYATNEEYTPPAPGAATQYNTTILAGLTTLQNLFATSIPAATNPTLTGLFDPNFFSDGMNRAAFIAMLTDTVNGPGVGFQITNFAEIAAPAGAVANDATHQWFTFTPIVQNALQKPEVWLALKDGIGNWLSAGNLQKYGVWWGTGSDWGVNPASHWLNISIDDPNSTIQSAVLSGGTGLGSGALSSMNNPGGGKRWSSFFDATNTSAGTFNYNLFPTLPVTYTLTITDTNGTVWSKPITYSGFNTNSVSNVTPVGNYTGTTAPTFSWTAPPGGSYNYNFQLAGVPRTPTSFFWSANNLGGATSVSYTGSVPLPPCSQISIFAEDANGNASAVNTYLGNNLPAGQSCGPNGVTTTGTTPVAGTNFDQMFISRNLSLPNTTENFGVGLRFPRAANDTLSSYSIACPGVPAVNGTFAAASQAGFEWVTSVNFSTQPATPFNCTSTVTYADGTTNVATATVDRFIAPNAYISGLSVTPNQNVTTLQTVSWTPTTATPTVGSYSHQGNIFSSGPNNSFGSQLWFFGYQTSSQVTYTGPALTANNAYHIAVTTIEGAGTNKMYAAQTFTPFCYQCSTTGGGTNFDQMFIGRNRVLPNATENFGVSLRFPRAANDTLSSYSIACPGVPAVNGTFATASQVAGYEWVTPVNFSTQPATPFNCTSTVTYTNGATNVATATVDRFIAPNAYVSGLSVVPNQNVTTLQTVSWTPTTATPTVGSYTHQGGVILSGPNNSMGAPLWFFGYLTAPTVTYAGPALTAGNSYYFNVATIEESGTNKMYAAQAFTPFCYQCSTTQPNKTNQTISFGAMPTIVAGGAGTISVTATSGLAVSLSSTTPNICTVSGSTVTGVVAGTCTIAANQAGDGSFNAAAQVTQSITIGSTQSAGTTLSLVPSWNLLGNSVNASLDVATTFSNTTNVATVWKWIPATSKWAFYAPSLVGQALTDYAASKGYDVLTTINGGEGYWVNAKAAFTVQLPTGTAISSNNFADQLTPPNMLPAGWSLIAIGDNKTPRAFVTAISTTTPVAGSVPTSLTTLWAWNSGLASWYFYAPSLDNSGGLASYITTKGYLNFDAKTLDPAMGFWVNHP